MNTTARSTIEGMLSPRIYHWLRLQWMRLQRKTFPIRVVEHTYGGVPLKVTLGDPVGQDWYDHSWETLPEIELLKHYRLQEGSNVFDLGAHQGVVAMMLAQAVGPSGRVLAVEANPFNASLAERNKNLNQVSQLRILNVAVSDSPGALVFNEDSNGQVDSTGSFGRIEVSSRTIDSLADEYGLPQVIFLDVEGFECQALRGASKALASRPDCFIEVHVNTGLEKLGGTIAQLISYFPEEAYDYYVKGSANPHAAFQKVEAKFFSQDHELLKSRFFLVTVARQN